MVKTTTLFDRRQYEWSEEKIVSYVTDLFKIVNTIPGWKFKGAEFISTKKKKKYEELKTSVMSVLKISLTRDGKDVIYRINIPDLIDGQFFFINGNFKIPIFQLYDLPIIYKETESGSGFIKTKLNTFSMSIDDISKTDASNFLPVTILNKRIPFPLVVCSCFEKEEFEKFYVDNNIKNENLIRLKNICNTIWTNSKKEDILKNFGKYYKTYAHDYIKKAKYIVECLNIALKVDIFSKRFLKDDHIIYAVMRQIEEGPLKDTSYENKRIRLAEYILLPLIKKVFNLTCTMKFDGKSKFSIARNIIEETCNVSDIVHYNFPINPTSEMSSILQCVLTGPGGFKKTNIPLSLRDMDPSQCGIVCAADTPDKEGCGAVLNMSPNILLDDLGKFYLPSKEENNITSYTISLTPFIQNNDQTRLQMASNQAKQAILLSNPEMPLIRSGTEDKYNKYSTFYSVAKEDGYVVHVDEYFMIVKYKSNKTDVFRIGYRYLPQDIVDKITTDLKEDDKFKKGDCICKSNFFVDDDVAIGTNLNTAITIYKGYNYEDGIAISETASKKLESVHSLDLSFTIDPGQILMNLNDDNTDYCPIPKIGQKLKKGQTYAKIKTIDGDVGFEGLNFDCVEKFVPCDCEIISIEIYPNGWNKKLSQYNKYVRDLINSQTQKYMELRTKLSSFMSESEINKFVTYNNLSKFDCIENRGSYTYKGVKLSGILFKINAIYTEKVVVGDKIANRHGHKGVIAKIIPDKDMLKTEDGRTIDVAINPLGIVSRMNVGQLYEMHLNEILYAIKNKMKIESKERDRKSILKEFLTDIYGDESNECVTKIMGEYNHFKKTSNSKEEAIDKISLIQPPFNSISPEKLFELFKKHKVKIKQKLFDPELDLTYQNEISVGNIFYEKLLHRANNKISYRSIGPYSSKTMQPLGGKSKQGGQRLGEMEVWALLGHGSKEFLKNLLTVHSDSPGLKNKMLSELLQNEEIENIYDENDVKPQTLRLLDVYFKAIGINLKNNEKSD